MFNRNRRVILKDPYRGLELVSAVQESILDPSPSVSALGLRALAAMCGAQVLDFYKAFKVCWWIIRWWLWWFFIALT